MRVAISLLVSLASSASSITQSDSTEFGVQITIADFAFASSSLILLRKRTPPTSS